MKLHLRLTLDVIYDAHEDEKNALKECLDDLPVRAAGNGLFTQSLDSEVKLYTHKVVEIKKKKRAPKKTNPK